MNINDTHLRSLTGTQYCFAVAQDKSRPTSYNIILYWCKGATTWGRGKIPNNIIYPLILDRAFNMGVGLPRSSEMFFYVFIEKSIFFKISHSTLHKIEHFEVRNSEKKSGEELTEPPPNTPLFLGLRFGLHPIRTPNF